MAIMLGVFTLPSTIFQKVLMPNIQNKLVTDMRSAFYIYKKGRVFMLILGLILGVFVGLSSDRLIALFYGDKYKEAGHLLTILSFCIPLRFVNSSAGAFLNSEETAAYKSKVMFVCALVSVCSSIFFIKLYGYLASGYILIFIEIIMLVFFSLKVDREIFKRVIDEKTTG
jgi:O-antigen/teichoic acid export membrane protein